MNRAVNPYQQTQVTTATPERLLIMLYDGAIRFVSLAREGIEVGDRVKKLESISRALAIITYLSDTLDHNAGWEQSQELDALYAYMAGALTRANVGNQTEPLKVVLSLLAGLRETWIEAIEHHRRKNAPASSAAEAIVAPEHKSISVES
jgi:flagellar protein FliS